MKKKRILVLAVCVCLVLGALPASGSTTQENSLVSLSYLNGTYRQELESLVAERVSAAGRALYALAADQLNTLGRSYLERLGQTDQPAADGWLTSDGFSVQGGEREDTITLAQGSSLLWSAGGGYFSGTLIDLTAGKELTSGSLIEHHRYVAAGDSVITVDSRTAHWSAQGKWQTTSDGIHVTEITFTDVKEGTWYYDAVCYVVEKQLFYGKSDTEFAPGGEMSRGMLTTVLHRLAGLPAVVYSPIFSDVPEGKFYTNGTIWAGVNQVVKGYTDGTFKPDQSLNRQQIALMIYNYANWLGLDTSARKDLSQFPDGGQVAGWAQDAVSWAVATGIMQGGSGGKLLPGEITSRAQVALMLQRFDQLVYA